MNDKRSSHQDELRRSREGFKDYGGVITDGNGAFNVELNRSSPLVATKFLVILRGNPGLHSLHSFSACTQLSISIHEYELLAIADPIMAF